VRRRNGPDRASPVRCTGSWTGGGRGSTIRSIAEAEVHPFRRSTGPLEGQINRLKVIKRETAEPGLELLKARVLPLEPLPTC
jgi:hypothetical protein